MSLRQATFIAQALEFHSNPRDAEPLDINAAEIRGRAAVGGQIDDLSAAGTLNMSVRHDVTVKATYGTCTVQAQNFPVSYTHLRAHET